jgi:hypothetical protein
MEARGLWLQDYPLRLDRFSRSTLRVTGFQRELLLGMRYPLGENHYSRR